MNKKHIISTLKTPAYHWTSGHVLGNGDLGAVVWGLPGNLHFGFSKHNVNDLRRNKMREGWEFSYQEMKNMALSGVRDFENEIIPQRKNTFNGPLPLFCGDLSVRLLQGSCFSLFRQELNLATATCTVKAEPSEGSRNWNPTKTGFEVASYIHAESNNLIVEFKSLRTLTALLEFSRPYDFELPTKPEYKYDLEQNISYMTLDLPEKQGFQMALTNKGGSLFQEITSLGIQGSLTFGGSKGNAYLLVSAVAEGDAELLPLDQQMEDICNKNLKRSIKQLNQSHVKWWGDFWGKSSIDYENKDIEKLWYMGVYALASSTRPEKSPPHLQGLWNLYDTPPWHADFHFNTNLQMCQWISCRSNHPELQEALIKKLTVDWIGEFRRNAKEVFHCDGIAFPLCCDWLGRAIGWGGLGLELSLTAWMASHVWEQWCFTKDYKLLEETVYPFLLECCSFYEEVLYKRDDGSYNIELSHSPEQIGIKENGEKFVALGTNPTIDLVFVKALFKSVIQAEKILEKKSGKLEKWQDIFENLPENPTLDGVLIDEETAFLHDGDIPGRFAVCHRHPSRLVGIFPGEEIGLHSANDTLKLGIDSFREFRSYGNEGFTGWSLAWQSAIAARLGLADEAENILFDFLKHFTFPGMLSSHNSLTGEYGMKSSPLFQIDGTIGAAAAVNEMLVQKQEDKVFLFPGVPQGKSASFQKLRLKDNIVISALKDKEEVKYVKLISQVDDMQVWLANPWNSNAIKISSSYKSIELSGDMIPINLNKETVYKITKSGKNS